MRLIDEATDGLKMGGELWCHVLASIAFDGTDTFRHEVNGLNGWEVFAYDVSSVRLV